MSDYLDLDFLVIDTPEKYEIHKEQLQALFKRLPRLSSDALDKHLPYVLVYWGRLLVGGFYLEFNRLSAEIAGAYSPRFEEVERVDRLTQRSIKHACSQIILDSVFTTPNAVGGFRKKAIAKIHTGNRLAKRWAAMYGFKPLINRDKRHTDNGHEVWVLQRKDWSISNGN